MSDDVRVPRKLYERILVAHQDAADALVDQHGDEHRAIVAALLAAAPAAQAPAPENAELVRLLLVPISHYQCEDCWYSCPKSGECCNDLEPKDICTCGADKETELRKQAAAALSAQSQDAKDAARYLHHVRSYYEQKHPMAWDLGWSRSDTTLDEFKVRYDAAIDAAMKERP